jgi:hypothetical protein
LKVIFINGKPEVQMIHAFLRKQRYKVVFFIALLFCTTLISVQSVAQSPSVRQTLNVLFIGNSYTYYNNLGDIVAGIAAADPEGPLIAPTLVVRGGATLQWHLENDSALPALQNDKWDYVILQEQSLLGGGTVEEKTVVGDPSSFYAATRELVAQIREAGAMPVLFMTWARREGSADRVRVQQQLADAYFTIGQELGVRVAPVGLAWQEAQRRLITLELHTWDGSHPSPAGSYLAGCVIYATLAGRSPQGGPAVIQGHPISTSPTSGELILDKNLLVPLVDLGEVTAAELQETAWDIVLANRE